MQWKRAGIIRLPTPRPVLREEFDDWALLFNPDTADIVGVSPVGVAVWKQILEERSLDEILVALREQFDAVPEAAPEEIAAFVDELVSYGFVGYQME